MRCRRGLAHLDANLCEFGKDNAVATYKGGIGFCPNLAICDNTDDVLVIDPRPGNAAANDAQDNIAALDTAVSRLPGAFRRRLLVRLDGAGFSHELLEHIAAGGGTQGRNWEFSVGWSCTEREIEAIGRVPARARQPAISQDGDVLEDTFVADITGLPGPAGMDREDPGPADHPARRAAAPALPPAGHRAGAETRPPLPADRHEHRGRAGRPAGRPPPLPRARRKRRQAGQGTRAEPVAIPPLGGQRGLDQIVALAANLLACFRHLALPAGELREAAPKLLRFRLLNVPARLTRGQRKRWLHLRADWPWTADLISAWHAARALPAPA